MGFFLHELIPLELASRYPSLWRGEQTKTDRDVEYIPDPKFSIEIKTFSDPKNIFGNRSYAQEPTLEGRKSKSGYYLTINFGEFRKGGPAPRILLVQFGWLDHTDWIPQATATGQQAHLSLSSAKLKLITIYSLK
jgi:hypothetical protein